MTIDERLEALAMHLELLAGMHEALEKNHEDFTKQMTAYAADVKDAITKLTNIAEAHDQRFDDHEERITDIEEGK